MPEVQQLLADFVETGSEAAFRELVSRYIQLVYSTAVRLVGGDLQLAEDVTQTVFIRLAQNARKLPLDVKLGGWLHRDTCFVASKITRRERRRQAREREAAVMSSIQDHSQANLDRIGPMLDDAINQLGEEDRTAILLRFFEERDFRAVGTALGSNEDAARMRVNRAIEKLHLLLKRRGVMIPAAALATALAGQTITAVPAGLIGAVTAAAIASSVAGAGITATIFKAIAMTKLKTAIAGAVLLAGVSTPIVWQHQTQVRLRDENRSLQEQLARSAHQKDQLSNQLAQASSSQSVSAEQLNELMRLRSQVGQLRQQTNVIGKLIEANERLSRALADAGRNPAPEEDPIREQVKQMGIAKMNDAKLLVLGMLLFSEEHKGQLPTSYEQISNSLASQGENMKLTGTNQFEMFYSGSIKDIPNPATTIVVREPQAWYFNGKWQRAYGFADGHSEIHSTLDGNFEPWEKQHTTPSLASDSGK